MSDVPVSSNPTGAVQFVPKGRPQHYRGDVSAFDPEQWFGPDRFGAMYRPIRAEYDATADRTTIWFVPVPVADVRARLGHLAPPAESSTPSVPLRRSARRLRGGIR